MAKRFKNRTSKEFRVFLEAHGFYYANPDGSGDDDIYARKGYGYTVKIPNRNSEVIPTGTASHIVRCIEKCGIGRKQILQWWKENGCGD